MPLAELERAFWAAVRRRGTPPAGLGELFTASATQTATERLAIYHRAYWQRQVLALASAFPRLHELLGAARFERLALRYLERWPGTEPSIEHLGADLPAFLADQDEVSALERDVARLEWASLLTLLAPDHESVVELPRDLGARLVACRVSFTTSLQVESVTSEALASFRAEALPGGVEPRATVGPSATPPDLVWVGFFRVRFAVRHVLLAADEARALRLARGGEPFGSICECFADLTQEDAVTRVVSVLSGWLARGWITRFATEGSSDVST